MPIAGRQSSTTSAVTNRRGAPHFSQTTELAFWFARIPAFWFAGIPALQFINVLTERSGRAGEPLGD